MRDNKASKTETLYLCWGQPCLAIWQQEAILFQSLYFIASILNMVRQVVFNVFVLLVHKMRQSAKLNNGFAPVSIYRAVFIPQSPNFHWICENLQFKYTSCCDHFQRWHKGVLTKSLWFMTPLSLLREVNIRFLSFSIYQLPFRAFVWGREVFHFMKPNKGDLGADTDLTLNFCWP